MRNVLKEVKKGLRRTAVQITQAYYGLADTKVECNICGYKTNRFSSNVWHSYTNCFNCGSDIRHRLFWATLQHVKEFSMEKIIEGKDVLHFAPEKNISDQLRQHTKSYKTADYLAEGYFYDKIDYNISISNMSTIANGSFDCVIACDVLEHVPDHIDGIKEVYRVLRKGGYCMFTVPQRDHLKVTYEDLSITGPEERRKAFGQADHCRIYGDDFTKMMEQCGFKVTAVDESFFSKEIVEKNVLFPPVLSTRENVTNFRKIFIGRK